MHYVAYSEDGTLSLQETNVPDIQPHQVLVKVASFGVNRADLLQKQGKYPPPVGASDILGMEVAGVIEEVGEQVTGWKIGDPVCAMIAGGGYAEYTAVDVGLLIPCPATLTMAESAAIPEVFLTAFQAIHWIGKLQSGQNLLIHAGASGVGLATIQLAKLHGANVAVTCSSEAKGMYCKAWGANIAINYKKQDFYQELKLAWGGVDLVIDMVAGDYTNKNLKLLNMDGRIIDLAIQGGRFVEQFDTALLLGKRATLVGSTLRNRSDSYKADLVTDFTRQCLPKFESGQLKPIIDTEFTVSDIEIAHERMTINDSMGKFIINW